MCNEKYYAHRGKNEDRSDWQELKVHLEETAELCHKFADKFKQGELGKIAGLLHDFGKYSDKFQYKITQDVKCKVIHATAGAIEAKERFQQIGETILAQCIARHHGGLIDSNDLRAKLLEKPENYENYKNEISDEDIKFDSNSVSTFFNNITNPKEKPFAASFLTRMIYSCLVDADWLNSAGEKPGSVKPADLHSELTKYLEKIASKAPEKPINIKRAEILAHCKQMAQEKKGLYSLTVPTGGGKTLSSMAFAMEHAQKHNMDRIIYAIPYTSIIEQNAQVFRGIFGEENVLEHHSNYIFEDEDKDDEDSQEIAEKLKKASENWDAPIIATTNVQFFESLFASRKKRCRKLHNIANSVIILDEAQMIPPEYLIPCVNAIAELVKRYGCTVVLCTATQPALRIILRFSPCSFGRSPCGSVD